MNWEALHPWLLSLEIAAMATAINALVAIPLAYALARGHFPGKWLLQGIVILPLVLPPTVVGFLLLYLIGKHGLYGALTGDTLLFTKTAAVIASAIVSFPLLVLPVRAAFANTLKEYDEEARIAGLSATQRFLHIALPLARGGILSGLLLAFARALGEFGATFMVLGSQNPTLPIKIYQDTEGLADLSSAWPPVLALAATSMIVIFIANRLRWLDIER